MSTHLYTTITILEDCTYSPDGHTVAHVHAGDVVHVNQEICKSLVKAGKAEEVKAKHADHEKHEEEVKAGSKKTKK